MNQRRLLDWLAFYFATFLWTFSLEAGSTREEDYCRFAEKPYSVGEKWHPILKKGEETFCVTCECQKDIKVNCTSEKCPVSCREGKNIECCKICEENVVSSSTNLPQALKYLNTSCYKGGQLYEDGQRLPYNATNSASNFMDCLQCICDAGVIVCESKICKEMKCSNPVQTYNDCCPVCPDDVAPFSDSNVMITFNGKVGKNCNVGGRYYFHGSTWHPVVEPFGEMNCVICRCNFGNIICKRLECPVKCSNPKKISGQCCPDCSPERDVLARPSRIPEAIFTLQHDFPAFGHTICLSNKTNTVTYEAKTQNGNSLKIQFLFQKVGTNTIELHSWSLKDDKVVKFDVQSLTLTEMRDFESTIHLELLGSTTTKLINRYTTRSKKISESCLLKCSRKIHKSLRILKLQKVNYRSYCSNNEIKL